MVCGCESAIGSSHSTTGILQAFERLLEVLISDMDVFGMER
jgi:hypothetical protein